jgi:hypothetical protein
MSYYADAQDVERQLTATVSTFVGSPEGHDAIDRLLEAGTKTAALTLRLSDLDLTLSFDFTTGAVSVAPPADGPAVEIEMPSDVLHDLLLDRLDPVQIARLYETDMVRFRGDVAHLGAMVMLGGPLSRHYIATLQAGGRDDLLGTPSPPTQIVWGDPQEAISPPRMIGERRPWQRRRRQDRSAS